MKTLNQQILKYYLPKENGCYSPSILSYYGICQKIGYYLNCEHVKQEHKIDFFSMIGFVLLGKDKNNRKIYYTKTFFKIILAILIYRILCH